MCSIHAPGPASSPQPHKLRARRRWPPEPHHTLLPGSAKNAAGRHPGARAPLTLLPLKTRPSAPHGLVLGPGHAGGAVCTQGYTVDITCTSQEGHRGGQDCRGVPPDRSVLRQPRCTTGRRCACLAGCPSPSTHACRPSGQVPQQTTKAVLGRASQGARTHPCAQTGCVCILPMPDPRPCKTQQPREASQREGMGRTQAVPATCAHTCRTGQA